MRAAPVVLALGLLLAAPGSASADVIFDPADADELAAVLAEAYTDQDVCYGWHVTVNDVSSISESVGSNFGAGQPVTAGSCQATVEFTATITYTSEASESEDSSSYSVSSQPSGVTTTDLDALDIDFDELTGENPDVVIAKAVTALPLLAADADLAEPISAAPETGTAPADAQLTDSPGSDWWRSQGGMVIWALILMAASGVLIWAVLKMNRRTQRRAAYQQEDVVHAPPVPDFPPPDLAWATPPQEQNTVAEPLTEPFPAAEPHKAAETPPDEPVESTEDEARPGDHEQARPAPSDQKDKE